MFGKQPRAADDSVGHHRLKGIRPYRQAVYILAAVAIGLVFWRASHQFFTDDAWTYWTTRQDYLAEGGLRGIAKALLVPHNGHVGSIIYLVFLAADWLFGMHTYWPYLVPVLLLHAVGGVLLFELLARRVRPGVALGTASLYLFMGNAGGALSTAQFVLWMVAIPAIWFGLLAIERHEGARDRRLFIEMVGVAVLASTLGFVVAFVLAGSLAVRRRCRFAALTFGAFVAIWSAIRVFLTLTSTLDGTGNGSASLGFELSRVGSYIAFVARGISTAAGDLLAVGWVFVGAVLVVASVVAAVWSQRVLRDGVILPTVGGALFFYLLVGIRGVTENTQSYAPDTSRYLLTAGTLLLPALAWQANLLIDRRRWAVLPLAAVLIWAVLGNATQQQDAVREAAAVGAANRITIETAASLSGHLDSLEAGFLVADRSARFTVEQFERLVAQGKVPCVADLDRALAFAAQQGMAPPSAEQVSCG